MKMIKNGLRGLAAAVLLAGTAGCATTGTPAAEPVRYQAESAQVLHSTHKKNDAPAGTERQSFYSGGLAAGGLNKATTLGDVAPDWSNLAYVRFDVKAPSAGPYVLKIAYNGDDDKTALVRVNGKVQVLAVPRLGDGTWNVMHSKTVPVELLQGANTLEVSGTLADTGWWNLDYIELAPESH